MNIRRKTEILENFLDSNNAKETFYDSLGDFTVPEVLDLPYSATFLLAVDWTGNESFWENIQGEWLKLVTNG